MATKTYVPATTQMFDSSGSLSKQWQLFFESLATPGASSSGNTLLLFTVPGTIGIRSNAAPLIKAPANASFTAIVAVVKQPPVGAGITARVQHAGVTLATVTIAAGATAGTVALTAAGISAGELLTLDITGVGTTFPGADLTVQLQA